jgi:hypothetical protein
VVVTVPPAFAGRLGNYISLYSSRCTIEKAYSSSKDTQCGNCWEFGHPTPRCKKLSPTCPFCAGPHTRAAHRCPNPTCPKGGNSKPVLACCPASTPSCPNCGEPHSARYRDCVSRPVPPRPFSPYPDQDQGVPPVLMDTSGDDGLDDDPQTRTTPTRNLAKDLGLATPRPRRGASTHSVIRNQSASRAPPPREPPSPSPMRLPTPGPAR